MKQFFGKCVVVLFFMVFVGCQNSVSPDKDESGDDKGLLSVFIMESDYVSGMVSSVKNGVYTSGKQVDQDAVAVVSGGVKFVLERTNHTVIRLGSSNSVSWQTALDEGFNPYDLALINSTEAWVVGIGVNYIQRLNISTGEKLGTISLESIPVAEGVNISPAQILVSGGKAYVALQMLDMNWSSERSKIAVVDIATKSVSYHTANSGNVQSIYLSGDSLFIMNQGNLDASWSLAGDGGVDILNINTGVVSQFHAGFFNGGMINNMAKVCSESGLFAFSVYQFWGSSPLYLGELQSMDGAVPLDDVVDCGMVLSLGDGQLVAMERASEGYGLYFYNLSENAGTLVETRLPPTSISLIR